MSAVQRAGPAAEEGLPLDLSPRADESLDSISGVQILQRRRGYRFNLDAVLLAHFAHDAGLRGPTIDLGTGTGVIPLILARKFGKRQLTAVELQPALYALAERNVKLNRCERRIALVHGDLVAIHALFRRASFAHAICNPPYRPASTGHQSEEREIAIARHELACSLDDVAAAASFLLGHRGRLDVVYPAARLSSLISALHAHALAPRLLRMVHPRAGAAAKLVLMRALKVEHTELEVLPPLILHPAQGQYAADVQQMLDG